MKFSKRLLPITFKDGLRNYQIPVGNELSAVLAGKHIGAVEWLAAAQCGQFVVLDAKMSYISFEEEADFGCCYRVIQKRQIIQDALHAQVRHELQ